MPVDIVGSRYWQLNDRTTLSTPSVTVLESCDTSGTTSVIAEQASAWGCSRGLLRRVTSAVMPPLDRRSRRLPVASTQPRRERPA